MGSENKILCDGFSITIEKREFHFDSFSGLSSNISCVQVEDGGSFPRMTRGELTGGTINFVMDLGDVKKDDVEWLYNWFVDVCDSNKELKKELIKIVPNENVGTSTKRGVLEYHLFNSWPCSWYAPSLSTDNNQRITETITFAYDGIINRVIP